MCGIFFYAGKKYTADELRDVFMSIQHRGPDDSRFVSLLANEDDNSPTIHMGFHRLAIMGTSEASNQPMHKDGVYLICNGEIFNYEKLRDKYGFVLESGSDCEVVLHMYLRFGIERTVKELDAEFAFVIWDSRTKSIYIARDPLGIRSLFIGKDLEEGGLSGDDERKGMGLWVASEMKALELCQGQLIDQFPPGYYCEWNMDSLSSLGYSMISYYNYQYTPISPQTINEEEMEEIYQRIRDLLTAAVDKRMMSSRKIATLLSGGLDSTLITALVRRHFADYELDTYSIGLEGSVDLYYARRAAEYLKTNHHEVVVTEAEFLAGIVPTIRQIESWCTTSIRASVGNYLVSRYIKKYSDNTVIFCGDLSDEVFASYRGFMKAPTPVALYEANLQMMRDVHYYDLLRSDKSISGAGLEARVPFGDLDFVDYIMSLPPELKMFNDERMEKYILRKAFEPTGLLPADLLWRRKEAFSDGVSSHERSWFTIIQEYIDTQVTQEEYELGQEMYFKNPPYDKESYYYRKIFNQIYPNRDYIIPFYWRHPFCTNLDPSARLLDFYKRD